MAPQGQTGKKKAVEKSAVPYPCYRCNALASSLLLTAYRQTGSADLNRVYSRSPKPDCPPVRGLGETWCNPPHPHGRHFAGGRSPAS
jgi:hypothetical protein